MYQRELAVTGKLPDDFMGESSPATAGMLADQSCKTRFVSIGRRADLPRNSLSAGFAQKKVLKERGQVE